MTRKFAGIASLLFASLAASTADAALVTFSRMMGPPSAEAVNAGAPANSLVNMYFLTSDADVLSVNNVLYVPDPMAPGGEFYQVPPPFGSDVEQPDPLFVSLNRALEADSWITTPGATSRLGGGSGFPGDGTGTWGDLSNNGPQANFKFATMTLPTAFKGRLTGRVSVAGATGPEVFNFDMLVNQIPEPGSAGLAAFGLLAVGAIRRRLA
jgi:hypothetical protein